MSLNDYAHYIIQKHRLCTALAIIRTKPSGLSTEQYMDVLKHKIDDENDYLDITVCSDDFIMEDDDLTNGSETILKDFDDDDDNVMDCNEVLENGVNMADVAQEAIETPMNTQTTYYEGSQNPVAIDNDTTCCEERTQIQIHPDPGKANTQDNAKNNEYDDTQKTILYTVHGFTQNCTHYSPSQNNINIPEKFIHKAKNDNEIEHIANIEQISDEINSQIINDTEEITPNLETALEKAVGEQDTNIYLDKIADVLPELHDKDLTCISNVEASRLPQDSDLEQLLSQPHENFGNVMHYSQIIDQYFEKSVPSSENNIMQVNNNHFSDKITDKHPNFEYDNAQNNNKIINDLDIQENEEMYLFTPIDNENIVTTDIRNVARTDNSEKTDLQTDIIQELQIFPIPNESLHSTQKNNESTMQLQPNIKTENKIQNLPKVDEISKELVPISENTADNSNSLQNFGTNFNENDLDSIADVMKIEDNAIPFKVLSDFKQVKWFLDKDEKIGDGYSTDSGYRSDSQTKRPKRALLSKSLNESAQCILDHLKNCPLAGKTRDITIEISEVLGHLIDRLYEQENCPPFLEVVLKSIDDLLLEMQNNTSSDMLLKMETITQRLIFVNKSIHIQRYSIKKLTEIIITYHSNLNSKEELYELTNINEIENLYCVFNVLEELLLMYVKQKDGLTQSSQSSLSSEKVFKKSSITEIWKRKWDPNYKDPENFVSRETKCILNDLGDVLNKIIVDCMNGYSLVSYAALKCFNLLQS